jgi:hypothetical protein
MCRSCAASPCGINAIRAARRVILKNLGRGSAISLVIVEGWGDVPGTLMAEVDALEPLGELYGPAYQETSRVGRRYVPFDTKALTPGNRYRVLYQDVGGGWHETGFKVLDDGSAFEVRMKRSRPTAEIPNWVLDRAQVMTGFPPS